jgi:hypothetical protein
MADALLGTKVAARKRPAPTHCKRGHEYGDTDYKSNGERVCRACKKDRANERRAKTGAWRHTPRDFKREGRVRQERLRGDPQAAAQALEYKRKWAEKLSPERRADLRRRKVELLKRRYRNDPVFRLKLTVKGRMRETLRAGKGRSRWFEAAGYSFPELKTHLERQFTQGMSWENYGAWHVDHIVPVSSFSFDSIDDPAYRACWALANLRPLWADENLRKSAKRLHLI